MPQPAPACNAPSALDHANAMLTHLRSVGHGHAHELARAMLASASTYLREVFGQQHALQVAADLLPLVLGVGEAPEALPGEVGASSVEMPVATLH